MKTLKLVFLAVVICLTCTRLSGQTESSLRIKPFGIGLHLEQFKLNDIGDLDIAPANKLIFSISPGKSFRLEPELGFKIANDKSNNIKSSCIYTGIGAYGMIQRGKLNIYGGLKMETATLKNRQTFTYSGTVSTSKTNRFTIGPAIGCEYYLGENFTFGGEVILKYASLKTSEDQNPSNLEDQKSNYFTTDTGLFIRFYF